MSFDTVCKCATTMNVSYFKHCVRGQRNRCEIYFLLRGAISFDQNDFRYEMKNIYTFCIRSLSRSEIRDCDDSQSLGIWKHFNCLFILTLRNLGRRGGPPLHGHKSERGPKKKIVKEALIFGKVSNQGKLATVRLRKIVFYTKLQIVHDRLNRFKLFESPVIQSIALVRYGWALLRKRPIYCN